MLIPPGFRFCPKDGELLVHYLQRKINNMPLPCQIIKEASLYRYEDPLELIANNEAMMEQREWYFFTKRKKVARHHEGGSNIDRTTRKGFWKATGSKTVEYRGEEVGSRMNLVFYYSAPTKKEKSIKSNWLMNEFKLGTSKKYGDSSMKLDEWVLCKVYNHKDNINTQPQQSCMMISSMAEHPETVEDHSSSELDQSTTHIESPFATTTSLPQAEVLVTEGNLENNNQQSIYYMESALPIDNVDLQNPNSWTTLDELLGYSENEVNNQFEPLNNNTNHQVVSYGEKIELPPTRFNYMEVYQNNSLVTCEDQCQQMNNNNGMTENQVHNPELIDTNGMPEWVFSGDDIEIPATGFSMGEEERLWRENNNDYTSIFI